MNEDAAGEEEYSAEEYYHGTVKPPNRIEVITNHGGTLESIIYRDTVGFYPREWEAYNTSRKEKKRNGLNKEVVADLRAGVEEVTIKIYGKTHFFRKYKPTHKEDDNRYHCEYQRVPISRSIIEMLGR